MFRVLVNEPALIQPDQGVAIRETSRDFDGVPAGLAKGQALVIARKSG
jgi:hypothetical protein